MHMASRLDAQNVHRNWSPVSVHTARNSFSHMGVVLAWNSPIRLLMLRGRLGDAAVAAMGESAICRTAPGMLLPIVV